MVVRLPHNLLALLFSGLIFASQYSLSYTAARTFARAPYSLSPVLVGAILLAFGGGGVIGSFVGGKMSDKRLERLKAQNGDSKPLVVEERLKAVFWAVAVMPACFIVYGWTVYFKVHIAAPIVARESHFHPPMMSSPQAHPFRSFSSRSLFPRPESNRHVFRHFILSH